MKKIMISFVSCLLFSAMPTEEGLLKNLHNEMPSGKVFWWKAQLPNEKLSVRIFFSAQDRSLLQLVYSDPQMTASQLLDVKFIPDLEVAIRQEMKPERAMFFSVWANWLTNKPDWIEIYLEKSGTKVTKTKALMNEDKLKLLKSYKSYLQRSNTKGETGSPLVPVDAKERSQTLALFKSNSLNQSKNIQLIKEGSDFLWKVDWNKNIAYFSNEELRLMKWSYGDIQLTASDYLLYNGVNELPKKIQLNNTSMEFLGADNRSTFDKPLATKAEEFKKGFVAKEVTLPSFLF